MVHHASISDHSSFPRAFNYASNLLTLEETFVKDNIFIKFDEMLHFSNSNMGRLKVALSKNFHNHMFFLLISSNLDYNQCLY